MEVWRSGGLGEICRCSDVKVWRHGALELWRGAEHLGCGGTEVWSFGDLEASCRMQACRRADVEACSSGDLESHYGPGDVEASRYVALEV